MPLTNLEIKNLKPKAQIYRVADGRGLCIEVTPSGSKLWRWRFRENGKPQMIALGKYPEVTLEQARKRRDEGHELASKGKHPTREKQLAKLRQIKEGENTFEVIARRWMDLKHNDLDKKYMQRSLTRLEKYAFPTLGSLPITEIGIPDVVRVIEAVGEKGRIETAKRVKQLIAQTFRYASQRGLCVHNPASDMRDILKTPTVKHYPCIALSRAPELLKSMETYEGEALVKYAMQLLSLTFVRTGELIGAKWQEIQWDRAEWHIPKERMKMKRPHIVPLSRQVLTILSEIQKITGQRPYIFYSSRSKSKHMSNGAILMALNRMGYRGVHSGHGYRTLASTILNEKGYKPDVIERQLAHEDNDKIRSAYNRAEYLLERKKMMQEYADLLGALKMNKGKAIPFSLEIRSA